MGWRGAYRGQFSGKKNLESRAKLRLKKIKYSTFTKVKLALADGKKHLITSKKTDDWQNHNHHKAIVRKWPKPVFMGLYAAIILPASMIGLQTMTRPATIIH